MIFKAAGNENMDVSTTGDYLCSRDDVVCVAATDENDCKASFSSYGSRVDISAPGTAIWSLYNNYLDPEADYVAAMSGTSMAAPLAAGVSALIWSQYPQWEPAQVKAQLFSGADDIYGLNCNSSYTGKLGAGRINAFNAVPSDADNDGIPDEEDNCPVKSKARCLALAAPCQINQGQHVLLMQTVLSAARITGYAIRIRKISTVIMSAMCVITILQSAMPSSLMLIMTAPVMFVMLSRGVADAWGWRVNRGVESMARLPAVA